MMDCICRISTHDLLESLDNAIIITDSCAKILYSNKQYDLLAKGMARLSPSIEQAIKEAALLGGHVFKDAGHLLITTLPIKAIGPEETLFLTQISDVANIVVLKKELEDSEKRREDFGEKLGKIALKDCIANSASMIHIFEKAKKIAQYPTTVLLVGETGVGKEVVTTFIHRNSDRALKPLINVNCSAIPEQLLESELFGYESGAFTGAKTKGKAGLFELANHGTILLDEIGDMNPSLQAKLLRALQEGEIMRLGGQKPIKLDVRVISSTNRDLKKMIAEGTFLDALYYRLNVVELRIPSLRDRREDIIPLAAFFLQQFCEKYQLERGFTPEVIECFLRYSWPGNIRELRNMVENLVVSSMDAEVGLDDLPSRMTVFGGNSASDNYGNRTMQAAVDDLQRKYISSALREHGTIRKAASALQQDPSTLHRLIKKLDIKYLE